MNPGDKDITIVILTMNEENALEVCLNAIPQGYPILVLDSGSTDRTLYIARRHGCIVNAHQWVGYAHQRNYALQNCGITTTWVLFIDADEVFPKQCYEWLEAALNSELACVDAVMFPSHLFMRGRRLRYAPGYPIYHARLLRRGRAYFLAHHEGGLGENVQQNCRIFYAKVHYEHYFYDGDLSKWMHKHVDHAKREQHVNMKGIKLNARKGVSLLFWTSAIRVPGRFLYHYVFCGGLLDGWDGLEYSLMVTWYDVTKYLMARYGNKTHA